MFKALNFSIDNKTGSQFGLIIGDFGGSGGSETLPSSRIGTVFVEMFRRDEPYFIGATMGNETPELSITFVSINGEIDRQKFSHIKKNLFNSLEPVTLKVLQDDLYNVSFKGIFIESNPKTFGNGLYGIETKFKMLSNFGLENKVEKPLKTVFLNSSDSPKGLKPVIKFTMSESGNFSITNQTNGIIMSFENLTGGETITVDCDKQIITSSLGLRRLSNFNKGWMVFESGKNILQFNGVATDVKVAYQNKKSVG